MKNNTVLNLPSGKTATFRLGNEKNFASREKMKRASKLKWVEALESGKYKQGSNSLFSNGKYCCLGVKAQIDGHEPDRDHGIFIKDKRYLAYLPYEYEQGLEDLGDFIGFQLIIDDREVTTLAECNDSIKLSFKDIAFIVKKFF